MMLYDMVCQKARRDRIPDDEMSAFYNAPIFDINNVAHYFWSHKRDVFDLVEDFPNMAPPFKRFWMEYRMPKMINEDSAPAPFPGKLCGVFVNAYPAHQSASYHWSLMINMYFEVRRDQFWGGHFGAHLGINEDGSMGYGSDGKPEFQFMAPDIPDGNDMIDWSDTRHVPALTQFVKPAMLAVSFLHCKNVLIVDHNPIVSKVAKKAIARGKRVAPRQYKTINIEPMKTVLRSEGNSEESGLKRALHICRGHFRTYSKDRPMFGKLSGTYYVPSHTRGAQTDDQGDTPTPPMYNIDL